MKETSIYLEIIKKRIKFFEKASHLFYQYQKLTPQNGLKMDENNLHSRFQESLAVSTSKSHNLSRLMCEHKIDIVVIQKSHTISEQRQTTQQRHRNVRQGYFS
jgi:hypothetical protein